ncbi:MAG: hypothetical protein H6909_02865 [Rickettsiaceae bacterium]|nr:hypothetical protein [Rickettsiaceae bacterium]
MHNPPDPRLQELLIESAKKGDVDLMIELVKQGANAFTLTEEDKPIISYLAHSNIQKSKMREFIRFITPYMYNESKK